MIYLAVNVVGTIPNNKAKIHVEPPWEGGTNVGINGTDHMTKVAATPIHRNKKLKYILLQNDDLETWHASFGTQALQSLY